MSSFFLECMHDLIFKPKDDDTLKISFRLHARKLALSRPRSTDCLHYVLVHADGEENDDHDSEMDNDDDDDDGEE